LGASLKFPSASILNGPVVIGVTSVFANVTAIPFKLSAPLPLLANTLPTVVATVVLGTCVGRSYHQSISLLWDFAFAISQFDDLSFHIFDKTI
jgi:hypothetical protein